MLLMKSPKVEEFRVSFQMLSFCGKSSIMTNAGNGKMETKSSDCWQTRTQLDFAVQ